MKMDREKYVELIRLIESMFGPTSWDDERGRTFKSPGLSVLVDADDSIYVYRILDLGVVIDGIAESNTSIISKLNANKIVAESDYQRALSYLESAKECCKTHIRTQVEYKIVTEFVEPLLYVMRGDTVLFRVVSGRGRGGYVVIGENTISLDRFFAAALPDDEDFILELETVNQQYRVVEKDIQRLGPILREDCTHVLREFTITPSFDCDVPEYAVYHDLMKPTKKAFLELTGEPA